jgi:tetratricopeptide (TPR) repeat protein
MDCTHCESVLLDLCYGELPPAQEREVRAHIHECPTCRKALSRLEAGQALARHLPDEAPSPEVTDRILRAAKEHLRQRGTWFERVQGLLESFGRIAMTRQVAMATMSLLIVFVGLWSIPELTHRRDPLSVAVESPPTGEAGPSVREPQQTSLPPAAAPETKGSEQKSELRVRTDESHAAARRKRALESAASAERSERTRGSAAQDLVAERAKPKAENRSSRQRQFATPPPVAAAPEAEEPLEGLPDDLKQAAQLSVSAKDDKPALGNAGDDRVAFRRVTRDSAPLDTEKESAVRPAPSASRSPATLDDVFAAGVERYRAEDYTAAAQLFARMLESSAPSAQRAAALLYLARSERALGRCDRAIRAYETLVRSYGSAQQSAVALSEGVACYDQLGDAAGAQRLLEHATSVPSLSAQATEKLHDRSAAKSSAGAAPSGAAQPRR